MINVSKTLDRLLISTISPVSAIQFVRNMIENSARPTETASKLVNEILGVTFVFADPRLARMTCQRMVELVIKNDCFIDNAEETLANALQYANDFITSPKNAFHYVEPQGVNKAPSEQKAIVAGLETKVAINQDGSVKRGGKRVLAIEMYRKHVISAEQPMANKDFVALLMSDLGMTKAGASTYAQICKKEFEKATA